MRSTSTLRTHLDSRLSSVWKSTGVTIVTRLRTRPGCSAAWQSDIVAALADAEQVHRATPCAARTWSMQAPRWRLT